MARGQAAVRSTAPQDHIDNSRIAPTNALSVTKDTVDPSLAALFQSSVGTFVPSIFGRLMVDDM